MSLKKIEQKLSGYYVYFDCEPIAGPFATREAACASIAHIRDPEMYTVDYWERLEKV